MAKTKLVQTCYLIGNQNPYEQSCGWARPEYHLISWAFSALQLRSLYGEVELYGNSAAISLLVEDLELPYAQVHDTHDSFGLPHPNLWALPKIWTYSLQNEPFLHVDGDVFLFEKFSNTLHGAGLVAQNPEVATEYYTSTQKMLTSHFSYFPPSVKDDFAKDVPIMAVNAGILGGTNTAFLNAYAASAMEYVDRNIPSLSRINVDRFNVFFEQHLYYCMARESGLDITYLFPEPFYDRGYMYLGNFHEAPVKRTYLHLLGHFKKDEVTCRQMASKFRSLYPEYYYKIMSLCNRKVPQHFMSRFYGRRTEKELKALPELAKTAYLEKPVFARESSVTADVAKSTLPFGLMDIFVKDIIQAGPPPEYFNLQADYEAFRTRTAEWTASSSFSQPYLYGRDLSADDWYDSIFNGGDVLAKKVSKTDECSVIVTEFDWAGLYNSRTRCGVQYYEEWAFRKGTFYNLLIAEVSEGNISLEDLDEIQFAMLQQLGQPVEIRELFQQLESMVDQEILLSHRDAFYNLLHKLLEKLVLLKAVKPLN
ncbi:hypothetical protein EPD60_00310 [Flaviaesturariibacter flavus]|uniref:DUF6734 domain-containing protein n=1 Tax=Flaviaesturariibacter flavus TaxID=2502780 RepID=A0A4R1BPV5_9BACT|nr:DUF6734 family protein [Flaviaesturariibacter flavus]TCJ19601.1 hypothetical protein EPD60_00310 [Flaviaesturariibacter flavus]